MKQDNGNQVPPLMPHEGSWVLVDRSSGRALVEVQKQDKQRLETVDYSKCFVLTITNYLKGIRGKHD